MYIKKGLLTDSIMYPNLDIINNKFELPQKKNISSKDVMINYSDFSKIELLNKQTLKLLIENKNLI